MLLRHLVTVEPYLGQSANGPKFGPPVTVRAFVDEQTREVRSSTGQQVVSGATVYCQLGPTMPPLSRVTLADGRQTRVINAHRHDGAGLPTPDHLEINLE